MIDVLPLQFLGGFLGDLGSRKVIQTRTWHLFWHLVSLIGIQIGGIGAIAPEVRPKLAKIGVRAMFGGALASFMTATIADILLAV